MRRNTNFTFSVFIFMRMMTVLGVFLIIEFFPSGDVQASFTGKVREAGRLYHRGEYDGALKLYNEALKSHPESDIINFNRGTVLYKKGDYKSAISAFQRALVTENKRVEMASNYNIGNCYYKLGEAQEHSNLSSAIENYKQALNYYRRAIELDNTDEDARYNYEFVDRKIDILRRKLKEQQKLSSHSGKGASKKEGGPESKKSESHNKKEKEEARRSRENKDVNAGVSPSQGKIKNDKHPSVSEENKNNETPEHMSEKEARMLLEGFPEKVFPFTEGERHHGYYPEVLNDW